MINQARLLKDNRLWGEYYYYVLQNIQYGDDSIFNIVNKIDINKTYDETDDKLMDDIACWFSDNYWGLEHMKFLLSLSLEDLTNCVRKHHFEFKNMISWCKPVPCPCVSVNILEDDGVSKIPVYDMRATIHCVPELEMGITTLNEYIRTNIMQQHSFNRLWGEPEPEEYEKFHKQYKEAFPHKDWTSIRGCFDEIKELWESARQSEKLNKLLTKLIKEPVVVDLTWALKYNDLRMTAWHPNKHTYDHNIIAALHAIDVKRKLVDKKRDYR